LEAELPEQQVNTWVRPLQAVEGPGTLKLLAPNRFVVDWVNENLLPRIGELLRDENTGDVPIITVEVGSRSAPMRSAVAPAVAPVRARRAEGLVVGARLNPDANFASFVEGKSNQLAKAASLQVAENPGRAYNPLFLYGGVGLGKTHLMHAIAHLIKERDDEARVAYVHSERFVSDMVRALQHNAINEFKTAYRSLDALLIDDIQFFAGKERSQEEFFHTFNELYQSGRQIIVTSDKPPKAIPTLEERLRSRFEGGLIADVQPPDLETRSAILRRKGESLGVHVSPEVLDYVARKVQSNIRELEGALNKIIALAQLYNAPIRMELAVQALNDAAMEARRARITPELVVDTVVKHFKCSPAELRGRGRGKDIVVPRQVAMYVLREETGASLVEIGTLLGGRDHSTVMHGIDKIEKQLEADLHIRNHVNAIREGLYAG
jgi:chromosomal replication initiator protein